MEPDITTLRLALACFVRSPDTPLRPAVQTQLAARLAARLPDGTPQPMSPGGMAYWARTLREWAQLTTDPVGAVLLEALDREASAREPSVAQVTASRRWMASTVREEARR